MEGNKILRRSTPIDTSVIRKRSTTQTIEASSPEHEQAAFITDFQRDELPSPNSANELEIDDAEILARRVIVWAPLIDGRARIISQGDLKFDLGQEVYVWDGRTTKVSRGLVNNLKWAVLAAVNEIPREFGSTKSPTTSHQLMRPWSQLLVKTTNENDDEVQTIFNEVTINNSNHSWVHVLGTSHRVHKLLNINEDQRPSFRLDQVQQWLNKLKIKVGDLVTDLDNNLSFIVVDYYWLADCLEPRYVVASRQSPSNRILNLTPLQEFDVRARYDHRPYYSYYPIEISNLKIATTDSNDDYRTAIQKIFAEIFDQITVYVVKKSLCTPSEIDSLVYEDSYGKSHVVSKMYNDVPEEGLRFIGITLTSYVKGLAYLENQPPADNASYIFFHSKDYTEVVLDETSPDFLQFVPTGDKQQLFRNPEPGDIILAKPFLCEKGQHTGKQNLKWCYPSDDFRLIHLFVTKSNLRLSIARAIQQHPISSPSLDIFNLLRHGLAVTNPTLNSTFTKEFIDRYFWWRAVQWPPVV